MKAMVREATMTAKVREEKPCLQHGMNGLQCNANGQRLTTVKHRDAFIGIDVGGTTIEGVLIDEAGGVITTRRSDSAQGDDAVAKQTAMMIDGLRVLGSELGLALVGIGIGIPGTVDVETGEVVNAVNLGISHFNLESRIAQFIPGVPIRIENDVNAAALGAWTMLGKCNPRGEIKNEMKNEMKMAFLNLGTGLACGIVDHGHIDHGSTGVAGEIGHIPVEVHGYPCACGQRGCLETVASGSGVAKLWPTRHGYALPALLSAVQRGDQSARTILNTVIQGMSMAVMIIAMSIDPQVIVIGGGLARSGQPLLDAITADLRIRAQSSAFISGLRLPQRLMLAPVSQPIGAIGAATIAADRHRISS